MRRLLHPRPQKVYEYLRAYGPAGPVELAPRGAQATLVVGHGTALRVLPKPTLFAGDSRR